MESVYRRSTAHNHTLHADTNACLRRQAEGGDEGQDEQGRRQSRERKSHNPTINATRGTLKPARGLCKENDTYDWRKLKAAERKAFLTEMQAGTLGNKQALVYRCLEEDIALKIKEQLLDNEAMEAGEEGQAFPRMGRGTRRTPARMTPELLSCAGCLGRGR